VSPVETVVTAQANSVRSLWLSIGARRIAWGTVCANGRTGDSQAVGSVDIVAAAQHSRRDLLVALASVPDDWAAGHGSIGLEVFVADRWLAEAVLPWSSALMRTNGGRAHAHTQLSQAGFDLSPGDVIRLDDAPFGMPRLAVAYPAELLSALAHGAQRWGSRLSSVLPASIAAWMLVGDLSRPRPSALAVLDDDDIVFVTGHAGTRALSGAYVTDLHLRQRRDDLSAHEDLREVWQRLCLRQPQWTNHERVVLLDGCAVGSAPAPFVKPTWASGSPVDGSLAGLLALQGEPLRPQALDAVVRHRAAGWRLRAALAVTAIAALFLSVRAMQTAQAAVAVQAEVDISSRPVPSQTAGPGWTREEATRVQAINAAIRELNLPIDGLLRSIEPPKDIRVAVLSVETSGEAAKGRSSLRIVAQTPSSGEMARYVGFVSERKPFIGAYLVRHEAVDEAGQHFLRFTVEAQWND
jgi:hypothetical protein